MFRRLIVRDPSLRRRSMSSQKSTSCTKKPLKVLLFDLDGCLYDADGGYVTHTRQQLFKYIHNQGWVENLEEAEAFWRPKFQQYNQTYRGLKAAGLEIDYDDYWATCRAGVDLFLSEDKALKSFLESLPQKKYVVSNCNETQVHEALSVMGIGGCFSGVYGAKFMLPHCKPEPQAFQKVLDDLQADPTECAMFEDSYKNLVTCNEMGMATIFVESEIHVREEGVNASHHAMLDAIVSTLSDEDGAIMREKYPRLYLE